MRSRVKAPSRLIVGVAAFIFGWLMNSIWSGKWLTRNTVTSIKRRLWEQTNASLAWEKQSRLNIVNSAEFGIPATNVQTNTTVFDLHSKHALERTGIQSPDDHVHTNAIGMDSPTKLALVQTAMMSPVTDAQTITTTITAAITTTAATDVSIKLVPMTSPVYHIDFSSALRNLSTKSAVERPFYTPLNVPSYDFNPDRGALDEAGGAGYVHDPASVRTATGPFKVGEGDCPATNLEGNPDNTWKMMTEHVRVHDNPNGPTRIFCSVYTHGKNHDGRLRAVRDTWGKDCDGFMAISDATNKSLGAVNLLHHGQESWNNMWQKVRSGWTYIFQNYANSFDWFIIGGDDLFVIVENLRKYVTSPAMMESTDGWTKPAYLGRPTKLFLGGNKGGDSSRIFNAGGAGYVLNTAALELLVSKMNSPLCSPSVIGSYEDVLVSDCFREHNVRPQPTSDERGRERFLPFTPDIHVTYQKGTGDWYEQCAIDLKYGFDCCSPEAITFHYAPPELMRKMYATVHGYCKKAAEATTVR